LYTLYYYVSLACSAGVYNQNMLLMPNKSRYISTGCLAHWLTLPWA